jgi:hypothetical protein
MRQIERFTGNKVSLMEIAGLEPRTRHGAPAPAPRGRRPQERQGFRSYGRRV